MGRNRRNGTATRRPDGTPAPRFRHLAKLILWTGFLAVMLPTGLAQQKSDMEARLKAVFIYNFISYTTWPDENPDEPYRIVVLGETPVTEYLNEIASNRKVGERDVRIEQASAWNDLRNCQVLYISPDEMDSIAGILQSFGEEPILTISDCLSPGSINTALSFYLEEGKLRFQVDMDRVRDSGLHLSSQLLKLARVVGGEVSS